MPRWARKERNQSLFRQVNDEIATLARFQVGSAAARGTTGAANR
jgi:hypothetical protein